MREVYRFKEPRFCFPAGLDPVKDLSQLLNASTPTAAACEGGGGSTSLLALFLLLLGLYALLAVSTGVQVWAGRRRFLTLERHLGNLPQWVHEYVPRAADGGAAPRFVQVSSSW